MLRREQTGRPRRILAFKERQKGMGACVSGVEAYTGVIAGGGGSHRIGV